MSAKVVATVSAAGLMLLAAAFYAGTFIHVSRPLPQEAKAPLPQEAKAAVKQLVRAKAAAERGASLEELRTYQIEIQAAAELAGDELSASQQKMIASVVDAIGVMREAWRITLDNCHRGVGDSPLAASAVILGDHTANCSDSELEVPFVRLGVEAEFGKLYDPNFSLSLLRDYTGPALVDFTKIAQDKRPRVVRLRSTVLGPLLAVCLSRLNVAIHAMQPEP